MGTLDIRTITITVRLPEAIAAQAEEVQKTDPEFLSRVILYGLTRRSIYQHLRQAQDDAVDEAMQHVFGDQDQASDDLRVSTQDRRQGLLRDTGWPNKRKVIRRML